MKEYLKKFSADQDSEQADGQRYEQCRGQEQRPVAHDLRFVVKESLNLGARFISEIERMLKKLED